LQSNLDFGYGNFIQIQFKRYIFESAVLGLQSAILKVVKVRIQRCALYISELDASSYL